MLQMQGWVHLNDQNNKDPELRALWVFIVGDTLHHQPMGAGHMVVIQFGRPMGLQVD